MRLHVPALKKVEKLIQPAVTSLLAKSVYPEGIGTVQISFLTGNLLVTYDTKTFQEQNVLKWIHDVKNLCESVFFRLLEEDQTNRDKIGGRLLVYLSTASENGIVIDKNFNIPDEIWDT